MDAADAKRVLLLRAVETGAAPYWSDADRDWATRVAQDECGPDADAARFVAARARAAWTRLAPRAPALAGAFEAPGLTRGWPWLLALAALLAGLVADHVGSGQRINLLAPPIWGVIGWNLLVYLALAGRALARRPGPGRLTGALARLVSRGRARTASADEPLARFTADWAPHAAQQAATRAAFALHLAAAALGVGLVAGLFVRGLVLDYRAAWQSTFLEPPAVQQLLATLLAPASAVAGIAVPDVAGIAALRDPGSAGASAAPWIVLYAWQVALLVVLPRAALALAARQRARRLAGHVALPLDEPYFRRLAWRQRTRAPRLRAWPYAQAPDAAAVQALRAAVQRVCGGDAQLQVEPTTAFGAEDGLAVPAGDGALHLALFDLSATPEAENHGRFLRALAAAGPVLALVDEAAFRQRFGEASARLPARRQGWAALAGTAGASARCLDLRDAAALDAALLDSLVR